MRVFLFPPSLLIVLLSSATVARALDFTPFSDGSIYACTELSNGKPAIGVKRGSGYGVTVDFASVKSKLKDKLKTSFQRRRALRSLLSKLEDDKKVSKTLLREFYGAYKELFDTVDKNLTVDQKIEALQQLLPRANSLIDGIGVELKALEDCKSRKTPSPSGFTYKVFVSPVDSTSIFVIVTTSAKGIDPNQIYCGEVPVVGSTRTGLKSTFVARPTSWGARRGRRAKKPEVYPLGYTEDFFVKTDEGAAPRSSVVAEGTFETGSTTRFVSGRLFPNPCSPLGCVAETGAGNVGLLVASLRTSSTQIRDENLGTYQATYSGSFALRKIKEGELCN